jgi:hypothetical protein
MSGASAQQSVGTLLVAGDFILEHKLAVMAALPLRDGSGWYVRADWPLGQTLHVNGFDGKAEAETWIETQGPSWIEGAGISPRAYFGG